VARSKGVNIFEVGSKNPGATNVRRVLGSGPGNLVFLLDALKGAVATGWPVWVFRYALEVETQLAITGLVASLLGHSFSCFTKFRGGKGVATATGGLLVMMPLVLVTAAAVWALAFYLFRYVSLASILAAAVLPIASWIYGVSSWLIGIAAAIALFVIVRHRTNIQRLLAGTETKFVKKPKTQTS
jgi:acyl phosphate:glycerol-3-phosphate acyltransferase